MICTAVFTLSNETIITNNRPRKNIIVNVLGKDHIQTIV